MRVAHFAPGAPRDAEAELFQQLSLRIHSWILVGTNEVVKPDYRRPAFDGARPTPWRRDSHHEPLVKPGEKVWVHVKAVGNCENGFAYAMVNVDHTASSLRPAYEYRLWLARINILN